MLPEPWHTRTPNLIADVRLYPTSSGGKTRPMLPGYGCPCFAQPDLRSVAADARLQLTEPLQPGMERRIGFAFLTDEGAEMMRQAGRFYLWDGRFVGEATVVERGR